MKRWFPAAVGLLLLNGAYLYSFDSPTIFYVANVFMHLGLGLLLTVIGVRILGGWRDFTPLEKGAAVLLTLGSVSGIALVITGTSRPYQPLVIAHIGLFVAGILSLTVALVRRRTAWRLLLASLAVAVILPGAVRTWYRYNPEPSWTINNPTLGPTSMEEEGAGPDSPFFPSASNTDVDRTIPSAFFMKPESCAQAGCHPDIYKQWQSSAHRFSSFNNQWYRKSIEYMQDVVGTKPSKWCAGCHDHAVFFNGMMDKPIKEQIDRPEAHAGLTCTSCHSVVSVGSTMGNGHFVIEYPPLHDLATSDNPLIKGVHDLVVHLDPGPHRKTFLKPFMREQTADYCSSCHKVHLDKPVNDYRWIRGFNDYDPWQNSGVSGGSARAFYYPKQSKKCADCHMPLVKSDDAANIDGFVHSHRFPAANTALPFVNDDKEQLRTVTEFLQNGKVGIDIFALARGIEQAVADVPSQARPADEPRMASTFAEGDELGLAEGVGAGLTEASKIIAPIDRAEARVKAGETVRVDVVVRTKDVGHFFPGGTVDGFDVWVELQAVDERGRTIFWSGYVPEDEKGRKGPVDPSAHFYRSFMLDERGNHINKRNAWMARSVLYVRLIPPGAADTVHFRLKIPEEVAGKIKLTAKVNYRKFAWWNTQWAYAGIRDPHTTSEVAPSYDDGKWVFAGDLSKVSGKLKEIPDLPIVTMAKSEAFLEVLPTSAKLPEPKPVLDRRDLIRWNDYGIGLLLQGDLKAAEEIFRRVTEIDPSYADGWVNMGRVRVQEGRTEEAQEVLSRALKLAPNLAKTHFFLGMTYKTQGQYEKALAYFRKAEAQYPRDRVVVNQIGRVLFLQRKFSEAVEALNRVLLVDPEDLQAHYNLMLAYRGLGNQEMAEREHKIYLRYKADESSQAITGPYRVMHPHDNNERQAIHEHGSEPSDRLPVPKAPAATVTESFGDIILNSHSVSSIKRKQRN